MVGVLEKEEKENIVESVFRIPLKNSFFQNETSLLHPMCHGQLCGFTWLPLIPSK